MIDCYCEIQAISKSRLSMDDNLNIQSEGLNHMVVTFPKFVLIKPIGKLLSAKSKDWEFFKDKLSQIVANIFDHVTQAMFHLDWVCFPRFPIQDLLSGNTRQKVSEQSCGKRIMWIEDKI